MLGELCVAGNKFIRTPSMKTFVAALQTNLDGSEGPLSPKTLRVLYPDQRMTCLETVCRHSDHQRLEESPRNNVAVWVKQVHTNEREQSNSIHSTS